MIKLDVWQWTSLLKQKFHDHQKARCIYIKQGDQYRGVKNCYLDSDGDLIIVIETPGKEVQGKI